MNKELLNIFLKNVYPWIYENNYTLHEAFANADNQKKEILNQMWSSDCGKVYLKSKIK